jgi:hypothetical protein
MEVFEDKKIVRNIMQALSIYVADNPLFFVFPLVFINHLPQHFFYLLFYSSNFLLRGFIYGLLSLLLAIKVWHIYVNIFYTFYPDFADKK